MSSTSSGSTTINSTLLIFIVIVAVAFAAVIIMYLILKKRSQNSDVARIENLRKGTEQKTFSSDVIYQKLYVRYLKIPFIKMYLLKIRRRLEINNLDDEFTTRLQTSKIITRALLIIIPLTVVLVWITHTNLLLMFIVLVFEIFIIDTITDSMVNKLDNDLLLQQIDFFAKMRHAYHETNMVAEAIYQTAQESDYVEISRQAEQIYNILNSADPETELEKYYDIAPNNFIKEFAGISYLTQEFGDRKTDNTSLYLTNLENITQEMQLEILKRDKLNYIFQSLSFIAIAPTILLEPIRKWSISNFSFTKSFYNGKQGMYVQILIMVVTFICYTLVRKLKDNGSTKIIENNQNPWEEKLYKKKFFKNIIDLITPVDGSKEYRKVQKQIKDAGSKKKIRWLYTDKLLACILTFFVSLGVFWGVHKVEIDYVYTEPTTDYDLIGGMSSKDEAKATEKTRRQNTILDMFRGKSKTTKAEIISAMKKSKEYKGFTDTDIETEADQIYTKLQKINAEYLKWFEVLFAILFAAIAYSAPSLLLRFQIRLRQMLMEDEVMSFQTIILMLMKIERVDVEMILEWLERYSDIFKEQIGKCLNNYESGAWEALEDMKEEVTYEPFIRIIESLQSSVERVPIKEAFEELDSDRQYYRDKRKETNDRLVDQRGRIGRIIGFAPMVVTFVGYLIIPLVFIGMTSMTSSFESMSKMS